MLPAIGSAMRLGALLLISLVLVACGSQSPDERLNHSLKELVEGIEARSSDRVMAVVHPQFEAKGQYDQDWARRTMGVMFLQNQRIKVLVLQQQTEIDPVYSGQARTRAQVSITGAERFIPDTARAYSLTLDWLEEDGDWLLHRLSWE
ncbi:MAG: hypothetical protein ACK4VV_10940 [Pseudomonas sp.]